ncbi:hypothetical protein [Zavarzinia sp. CC-PAN008]|uniref:hypothetical protein n=1 Tax=Zavarzinia sp. CC-PAN008 TaxID=3243332 RepID=UPI003F74A8D3
MLTMRTAGVMGALAVALWTAGPALAEGKQDFRLINQTGYEIHQVYVSPNTTNDWEEDVLGQDTLANGDAVDISFSRDSKPCMWDLKVIYTVDGSDAIWTNIDLCTVSAVTIHYDAGSNTTSATFD